MPENQLLGLTVTAFLDRLESREPTPGGGSVAALVGSLAAGLGHMACEFTVGRPKFAAVEADVQELAQRLRRAGAMLRRLTEEDAAAYAELSQAFKLPKEDPTRADKIAAGAAIAAGVPFQTAALSRQVHTDLTRLLDLANPRLRTDVEAGLELAQAAIAAAAANVRANLPFLAPADADRIGSELTTMLATPTSS